MTRIRPGTVTVGVIAILFGLVTAYAARHAFDRPAAQEPTKPMAAIVVPTVNLPKFSRIGAEEVTTAQVPVDEVPEGAVRVTSQALARLVKTTIMAGRPILEDDLYAVGEVPLLADQVPPGLRAVTLQVDANTALNGMIQPESHVDVVLTVKGGQPAAGGLTTLTLLGGVQVLATSQARFPNGEDRPGNLRNITVAVSPAQANKLILAQRYGTLSVTLRSNLESDRLAMAEPDRDPDKDLVSPNDLLGLVPQPVPETAVKRVQVWRGGQMEEIAFDVTEPAGYARRSPTPGGASPTAAVPVSSQDAAAPGSGCKECQQNQGDAAPAAPPSPLSPRTTAQDEPTLAPPSSTASLAARGNFRQGARGQIIYVQVEADGSGRE